MACEFWWKELQRKWSVFDAHTHTWGIFPLWLSHLFLSLPCSHGKWQVCMKKEVSQQVLNSYSSYPFLDYFNTHIHFWSMYEFMLFYICYGHHQSPALQTPIHPPFTALCLISGHFISACIWTESIQEMQSMEFLASHQKPYSNKM